MESAAAPVSRTQTRGTETLERGNQETAVLQRRRDIPFPRPGHPDTERMGNRPGAVVSAWRRPLLGRYQHPCTTHVRAPWRKPRTESRMPGNLHVRFGEGGEETCPGNGVKRFIPTLRARTVYGTGSV